METKYITIPFDLERAKRIQEGKEEGKIVTRNGYNARIVCWDMKNPKYPIMALYTEEEEEIDITTTLDGMIYRGNDENEFDLVLEVPEYTQYKDGDVLIEKNDKCPFIYKSINNNFCDFYAGISSANILVFRRLGTWCPISKIGGYANEEQRQKLINALKESEEPLAKEYLKRFFNIEEEEFQPFDKVLVRDKGEDWKATFFSHYIKNYTYPYFTTGNACYKECIPYNEETKHLLGTDKPYINNKNTK